MNFVCSCGVVIDVCPRTPRIYMVNKKHYHKCSFVSSTGISIIPVFVCLGTTRGLVTAYLDGLCRL